MKIEILDPHLANLIAAGEVVDRPLSVVRELVDNAIDAGATQIDIKIEQGGQLLVEVQDDGIAMSSEDAVVAFKRHATSKIKTPEELQSIASLGFRGEALPSIASVSKVRLVTREKSASVGTEVLIEAGELRSKSALQSGFGTLVQVKQLFYNTPARKKFLKSPKSDEQKIKAWLVQSALINPHIRFRLRNEEKELVNLAPEKNFLSRAETVFKSAGVSFNHQVGPINITGLLLHPGLASDKSGWLVTFVNGRMVNDRMILKAIKEGFQSTLKDREFPVGALEIRLLPEFVDVNVHPQKAEVRFSAPQAVFQAVYKAVSCGVNEFKRPISVESISTRSITGSKLGSETPGSLSQEQSRLDFSTAFEVRQSAASYGSGAAAAQFKFADLRYIGLALNCYLFCEHAEKLVVVDMHAAHERYNYNLIRNNFSSKEVVSQDLLVPLTIRLGEDNLINLREHESMLCGFGFVYDELGADSIVLRSIPTYLKNANFEKLFLEIALSESETEASRRFEERLDHIAARMACHASVRSGDLLESREVYALFESLDRSEFSAACPHGRPIVVEFQRAEVERWFGRDR